MLTLVAGGWVAVGAWVGAVVDTTDGAGVEATVGVVDTGAVAPVGALRGVQLETKTRAKAAITLCKCFT